MENLSRPLVSVVTPFYNTEAYLQECIETVLAQTFRDFEYILVDNCSTDGSVAIAERYAAADARIRFLRNDRFVSQLQNYNGALRQISPQSRYVKIVQADDTIFPRCLEEMVAVAEAHPTVGVVSSYRMVEEGVGPGGIPRSKVVMSGREACRLNLINDLFLFGSQTTVMMRADLVRARDPFYADNRYFADSDAMYELLVDHDFAFIHQVLSYSRVDRDSIAGRIKSYEPLILDRLLRLKRYGPVFLSKEEYEPSLAQQERVYRRALGDAWFKRRGPAFWEFHRKGLATIGEEIGQARVAHGAFLALASYLAWPQVVARSALKRARRAFQSH